MEYRRLNIRQIVLQARLPGVGQKLPEGIREIDDPLLRLFQPVGTALQNDGILEAVAHIGSAGAEARQVLYRIFEDGIDFILILVLQAHRKVLDIETILH